MVIDDKDIRQSVNTYDAQVEATKSPVEFSFNLILLDMNSYMQLMQLVLNLRPISKCMPVVLYQHIIKL